MSRRLRSPAFAGVALLVLLATLAPGQGLLAGGFGVEEEEGPADYRSVHLPLSAKAARTWIALHETMVKPPPDGTPFGEVIASLKAAARGKDAETPFEWYLRPLDLKICEVTMTTPVPSSFVGQEEVSLEVYLGFFLRSFGLDHRVHDGTLIIETPYDDWPNKPTITAAEAWTWRVLHEVVPLHFPDETPLKDVLAAIQRGTVGKGKSGRGLAIYVDPVGLKEAEEDFNTKKATIDLNTKVTIDLERAALCTALGLVLKQLGLEFSVRSNGMVVITSHGEDDGDGSDLMDEAEAVASVQYLRYVFFHAEQSHRMELRRLHHLYARPASPDKPAVGPPGQGMR